MTAIEWLIEQWPIIKSHLPPWLIHQALEMEKEQIMQAYKFNATGEPDGAEHYYEMFYKKY